MTSHTDQNQNDDLVPENADEAKGRAKEAIGAITGDQELQREGRDDQAEGQVKSAIDGIADKAKDVVDDVRQRIDR